MLEDFLDSLCDGLFHDLDELQEKTELSQKQAIAFVHFLTEFGFAEINDENKKVRISKAAKMLFGANKGLPKIN